MSQPASLAKTSIPSLSTVLPRERLFSVLDQRRSAAVVWVSGPPGSGKTTLIATYLEARRPPALWYQFDVGDSDVATFFYYLSRAVVERLGDAAPALPTFSTEYRERPEGFARRFFEVLFSSLASPFTIVLDNFHELEPTSRMRGVLVEAASVMPPDGCLIVSSREDPPAELARLRANRDLEMLGWKDLRLTRRESDHIVEALDGGVSEHAREQLYEKTDGWAAGVVLLVDHLRAAGLPPDLPDDGTPQVVFDYLAGEVFDRFDEATRSMLVRVAYLRETTGPMACEVSGQPDAAQRLESLRAQQHLVSVKTVRDRVLFVFHPLLHDFLVKRASQTLSADERRRFRRASSELLEADGDVDQAIGLLRDAEDWDGLSRLVLRNAAEMLRHGRAEPLERWLEELPESVRSRDPWTVYWHACCRFISAPRESRILFEVAYLGFERDGVDALRGRFLACSGAMDAIIHELDDLSLLDGWIARANELLAGHGEPEGLEDRARFSASMFMALVFRQPHHTDLVHWAEQAFALSKSIEDVNARLSAQLLVAINLNYTGQFAKAEDFLNAMRRACRDPHVTPLAATVLKDVESMHLMLTADHERCMEAVYEGIEIGRSSGVHHWIYHLLSNGVASALGAGDIATAEGLLAEMESSPDGARRLDLCNFHYYSAWKAMLGGDVAEAFQHQKTALRLAVETGCPFYEALCRLAFAQVLVATGEPRRAASQLSKVRQIVAAIDNRLLEFMCLVGYAHIAFECGRESAGRRALASAFRLGRENGFTHFVWWLPEVMATLCVRALEADVEVDYARQLVRDRGLMAQTPPVRVVRWPWRFRIFTFGTFEVLRDDQPLGLFAKIQHRPMEVLKALASFGGENVRESLLAESLWPRIDADYAHKSLTTNLHRLRKLLGVDEAVRLKHGRLTLDTTICWLDQFAFDALVGEVEARLRSADARPEALEVDRYVDEVLALYRGPMLADEPDVSYFVASRERHRNRFIRCIGGLARYWEEAAQWDRAVDCLQRSIDVDCLAEGFYRRLMLCLREGARQAEAVEVYDRCRRTFRAELSTDPSAETTAIYESLLGGL